MKIPGLLAAATLALGISTGEPAAQDDASYSSFLKIISVVKNIASTTSDIGQTRGFADVRLVPLDNLLMGKSAPALFVALAAQRGTLKLGALREAIAGNWGLVIELQRQHVDYRSIVAIDISKPGTVTVYTYGTWA
jgi:hypothetical protein